MTPRFLLRPEVIIIFQVVCLVFNLLAISEVLQLHAALATSTLFGGIVLVLLLLRRRQRRGAIGDIPITELRYDPKSGHLQRLD